MVAPVQKDSLTDYQVALATYLRITSPISGMFTALDEPRHLGAFFLMLDPMRFAGGVALAGVVEQIARALSGAPVAFPTFAHVVPDVVGVPDA